MMLQVAPLKHGTHIPPEDALLRLLRTFDHVSASRTAADADNARLLAMFEQLASLKPIPDIDAIRAAHAPGSSVLVRVWDGADPTRFVQATLRPSTPIELVFSKALGVPDSRSAARRFADALGYGVFTLSD